MEGDALDRSVTKAVYYPDATEVPGLTAPISEIRAMSSNLIAMPANRASKGARQGSVLRAIDQTATHLLELLLVVLALGLLVPVPR